jgi:hypothetical protein
MILLDWTRMGKQYCVAGVVAVPGGFRVIRPLMAKNRSLSVRNVGWSPFLLDGYSRWEIFELIGPEEAKPEAPHLEDLWVRSLRPRRQSASPKERRAILAATLVQPGVRLFGAPLQTTRTAAYLQPGTGQRSLATLVVPANRISFTAHHREGAPDADFRVALPLPELGERWLPVKDHHLLAKVEMASPTLEGQIKRLSYAVQQMGDQVAVRLGLSRPFQAAAERGPSSCWLMADGFFSLSDPQP